MLLKGKVAVIYGATGGVGSVVARSFAQEGARLFLAARNGATLATVADSIGTPAGGRVEIATVDANNSPWCREGPWRQSQSRVLVHQARTSTASPSTILIHRGGLWPWDLRRPIRLRPGDVPGMGLMAPIEAHLGSDGEGWFGPDGSGVGVPAEVSESPVGGLAGDAEGVADLGPGGAPVQGAGDGDLEVGLDGAELGGSFGGVVEGVETESVGPVHGCQRRLTRQCLSADTDRHCRLAGVGGGGQPVLVMVGRCRSR